MRYGNLDALMGQKTKPKQTQFKPISMPNKPNQPHFKLHPYRKKIFKPDNIKKHPYLFHWPVQPVRCDMRTSGKKVNTSIENINFQTTPEKDTIHPAHNEYFHHPFRMNKQGKQHREPASLIKE